MPHSRKRSDDDDDDDDDNLEAILVGPLSIGCRLLNLMHRREDLKTWTNAGPRTSGARGTLREAPAAGFEGLGFGV